MNKAKDAVKGSFAMFFSGLSALDVFPASNYAKSVPNSAACVTRESWRLTEALIIKNGKLILAIKK